MTSSVQVDIVIFGGGAAGLWSLDRLRKAGYKCLLLESRALGAGQTIRAQGIIHGGGKYVLRSVRDFAAVRSISGMPQRWLRCLGGQDEPDLSQVRILSKQCLLWLPVGSWKGRIQSWGLMPILARSSLLASRPWRVPRSEWPMALRKSALDVYTLEEPVVGTGSLLECLAAPHRAWTLLYDPGTSCSKIEILKDGRIRIESPKIDIRARAVLLVAGEGNANLLEKAGIHHDVMQRRPLSMILLRGPLPALFGHCILGGKTQLTVTTAWRSQDESIWQIGGEVAERAGLPPDDFRNLALATIRRCLPGLDLSSLKLAVYRAVRAEAQTKDLRRPSGVHMSWVTDRIMVAWPTKLALVPVLADEICKELSIRLQEPSAPGEGVDVSDWPAPDVAPYPWENAEWFPVH